MASSTGPWSVSVSQAKRWERHLTHFLEATTHPRLSTALLVLRHSRTSTTGLEHGHSKVKACTMELSQCKNLVKTLPTQQLLTPAAPNCQFLPMYLRRSGQSGNKLYQTLTARQIRLSAMLLRAARQLHQRSSQLASR